MASTKYYKNNFNRDIAVSCRVLLSQLCLIRPSTCW